MQEQKRRRVIKKEKDTDVIEPDVKEPKGEDNDTELIAAVSYKLNESTILIRNLLAKSNNGHSEMEISAFVDALAAIEIAVENPKHFIEARAQYYAKPEEEVEKE